MVAFSIPFLRKGRLNMLRVPWRRPRERARWLPIPSSCYPACTSTRGLERAEERASDATKLKRGRKNAHNHPTDLKLKLDDESWEKPRHSATRGATGAMEAAHGRLGNACLLLSRATGALEAACAEYEAAQQTVKRWCVIRSACCFFRGLFASADHPDLALSQQTPQVSNRDGRCTGWQYRCQS